jgi:hypothetical protein
MERLRDVLNGTWAGSYGYEGRRQSHRTNTQLTINSNISAGTLKINGGGRDQYGEFTFEGSATSENEISCVKKFKYGWSNNWWHKARVDLDKKEMHGQWGPAIKPNQTDGSLVFQRQMTEEERQQEAAAAARRKQEQEQAAREKQEQEEEARKKQEQEEEARKKQEQEEAARKKQEQEEEARKKQEQEEATRKKQEQEEEARKKQEQEEAAKKKQEQEEAAKKKQEQEEAARKKQEQEKEEAAKRPKEEGEEENSLVQLPDTDSKDKVASRPQETAQTTAETGKPVVSTTDSEHDIAGNLKIYLKLDLDADIRVIATLRGDIALGIQ